MPRIPYQSEVSALSGRSNSPLQSANTNPDAFGANVGRALQDAGEAGMNRARVLFEVDQREKERKRKEDAANKVATFDWTDKELQIRNSVGADADDYQDRVREGYVSSVEDYIKDIEDDDTRIAVRQNLMADLPNISSRSAQYEFQMKAERSKELGNQSLNALQNKISLDPTAYDSYREQGNAVIDALPNTTAAFREGMKVSWKYDSAKRRFDGMIGNVKTIDDIDNIASELAAKDQGAKDWQSEMLPADYESLMNTLGSMRKTFNDRNNTDARAILTSLEERTKTTPTLLPPSELTEMSDVVKRTTDPSIRARAARIMRNQEIIRQEQRLPPAELRARINAANGNPGLAYPGLPGEMSDAINNASEQFGVSASYLGAVAQREYGSEFAKARKKTSDPSPFKPQVTEGIDVRNMRSDVVDAVTLAGQVYGAPMIVTSAGKGVTTASSAVNIATVGMDGTDKAKVAAALVDAGFTGISEYDGYIQADMVAAVPKSFKEKDGKVWGGWTYLSPEVANVLKERGFQAGADSAAIKRNKVAEPQPQVNYDAPTGIVDENGKPTSSARGVFQFTEGTWLRTVKNPTVAAAMGIDLKKTDAELLAMRGDPRMSTLAAAAYARENQRVLENTLGRPVTEAELYMAHFLGAGGATQFLTAYKNNPEQSAATLMPEAAKANKPVFFDKGRELSVEEVYMNVAQNFSLAPTKIAYEDNEVRQALLRSAEKTLSEYPLQHAMNTGSHVVTPLNQEGGFAVRGSQSRAVADYYNIPLKDMKPFTQDEEAFIKKTISEGSIEDNLALMANIQQMGEEPAKAALKQLGEKDGVFAHSADLYLNGNAVVAGDIVRGRKRLAENPSIEEQIGTNKQALSDEFVSATGSAVYDLSPSRRQTIQEAATALYVERMATGGGNMSRFDRGVFEQAVQEVMGGKNGMPAIDVVNGNKTYMPPGITADELETAFDRMNMDDWTRMSETGEPPRYADGTLVDPADIRNEVTLRAIGGGQYKIALDDGTLLTTGKRTPEGRMAAYIFVPDADYLKRVAVRPRQVAAR